MKLQPKFESRLDPYCKINLKLTFPFKVFWFQYDLIVRNKYQEIKNNYLINRIYYNVQLIVNILIQQITVILEAITVDLKIRLNEIKK